MEMGSIVRRATCALTPTPINDCTQLAGSHQSEVSSIVAANATRATEVPAEEFSTGPTTVVLRGRTMAPVALLRVCRAHEFATGLHADKRS